MDQLEEGSEVGRSQKAPVAANELRECVGRGLLRRGGEFPLGAFDLRDDRATNDLAKQLFLVGEVEIDGALREAGTLGDVFESGCREAALAEDRECRIDDLLRSLLGEPPPTRFL